ncbi:uncharacterized protein LOC142555195 isoform X5 [Primulina tabacum]|uniref:uncharacterized protein LOC142555195 isoform X5 n=1 Tax=Primulina tabacum TaxID=48773 RepID=UPI003F5A0EAC
MDEFEFRHLLENFPLVRSRDYHVRKHQDVGTSKNTRGTELNENANHEGFWGKLMLAAEQKVGAAEAERFCKAFQQVYEKLVYEELPLDAARKFINS